MAKLRGRSSIIAWAVSHALTAVFGLAATCDRAIAADEPGFDCLVKPSREVRLSVPVAGVIGLVAVDRGDVVEKGDVVAALDSAVEEAALALARRRSQAIAKIRSAQARVAFLRRKSERSRKLNERQIVSESALEEADTNLAVAEEDVGDAEFDVGMARLELDRATALLNQRTVRSPIKGVVIERKLSPGEYWGEREPVATIAELDPLFVETFVPIAMHGGIHRGDRATIRPEDPIGGTYEAVVNVVDHVYDAASSTFGLRLTLNNPNLTIPAGIRCRVSFDSQLRK